MHVLLHGTFASELVHLRASELRERHVADGRRRHPRRPLPRRAD